MAQLDAVALTNLFLEGKGSFNDAFKFTDRQQEFIVDTNQGNYNTQPVTFNFFSQGLTKKLITLDDAFLQIPLKISPSTGNFQAEPVVAFKDSVLSLFDRLIVTGEGGKTILNHSTDLAIANALRMMFEDTHDWLYCSEDELQAYKDEWQYEAKLTTAALLTTDLQNPRTDEFKYSAVTDTPAGGSPPPSYQTVVSAVRVQAFNSGFKKRNFALMTSAISSSGTWNVDGTTNAINTILRVPLRYIHPFFEGLNFPIINLQLELQFGLNIPGQGTYVPICSGRYDGSASVEQTAVCTIPAGSTCRLYFSKIKMRPEDAEKMASMMKSRLSKTVSFSHYQVYRNYTNITSTDHLQHDIVTGISGVKRVWLLTPPTGAVSTKNWPSAMVTGPMGVRDCNIVVNGSQYLERSIDSSQEWWNVLRAQFPMEGKDTAGRLNYGEFLRSHRIHCIDISRPNDKMPDPNAAMSISVLSTKTNSTAADYIYILELERAVTFDITWGGATVTIGTERLS